MPTYLKTERGLTVVGTGGYLTFLISGAFLGYLTGGYLTDRLGRQAQHLRSSPCCRPSASWPTRTSPAEPNSLLLVLGFPLGFCMSAIFSGFGSYPERAVPDGRARHGPGLHVQHRPRRGRRLPHPVGFLADSWGVGGALVFGAIGYGIAALALLGLPETRGKELA